MLAMYLSSPSRPLSWSSLIETIALAWMSCLFAQVQTAFAEDGSPERAPIYVAFSYEAERECLDEEQAFSLVHRRSRRVVRAREQTPTQELAMRIVGGSAGYRGVL